jgi:hypothetical protein
MGILKSLFELAGKVASVAQDMSAKQNAGARPAASAPAQKAAPVPERTDAEWRAYFREIIRAQYPNFAIREDVPVTEMVGDVADEFQLYESRPRQVYKAEWGQPYTFVLYRGEKPAGVVMLGGGHSHDKNVKYLISRMYCKKLGMPYINFYLQMENERNYVIGRIKDLMLGH